MDDYFIKTFEGLFEQAEDTIIITTPSRKVEFMNKKAANLFQCVNDVGFYLMLTEPSKDIWKRYIEKLEKNSKDNCVITVQLVSKQFLTIRLYSYYMPEHQLIVSRITVPPLLKNEKTSIALNQPISSMIQNIADGVVLTSLKGQIVAANAQALQYLECELEQIENRSHDVLFMNMEQEGKSVVLYYRQLAKYEDAKLKVSKMRADGQIGYYHIESRVDMVLEVIITTIIDETEKMTLLNKAEHQDSLFLIGQNLASIAHELRNPITSLTGFLQLIREEMTQEVQHFVQIMESELRRMDLMLEDLLSFSKPSNVQFETFCLLKLVQEVTDLMQVQAILSSTMLEIECKKMDDYYIYGHRARIKQMIINLVKNAIEATSYRGKIIMKLTAPQSGKCALIVSDEGMGMTQQTLEKLFNAYYTTKVKGTGLGMMFVKKVVEEHNAEMMLCTDVGYGTQIKIAFNQQKEQMDYYMQQRIFAQMPSQLSCG